MVSPEIREKLKKMDKDSILSILYDVVSLRRENEEWLDKKIPEVVFLDLRIVRRFKKKLSKLGVEQLIFFGSRVNGTQRPESDFDFIAISQKFKRVKWYDRPIRICLSWTEKYPLEVLCYTPKEFEKLKGRAGIVKEAIKGGIVV